MSDEHSQHPDPSQVMASLREIARAWQGATWLGQAASVSIGREASDALLEIVRIPLRRAAMQQINQMRISLLECEPRNPTGKGETDRLVKPADRDCS